MGPGSILATLAVGLLCLTACGTQGDDAGAGAQSLGARPTDAANAVANTGSTAVAQQAAGCRVAQVNAESDDLTLLSIGRDVYGRLDCQAPTPLKVQLAYVRGVPEIAAEAAEIGATMVVEAAGDGAGLRIYSDLGTCVVTVSDNPKTKTLACG